MLAHVLLLGTIALLVALLAGLSGGLPGPHRRLTAEPHLPNEPKEAARGADREEGDGGDG
jgi:hypothetical protein